MPYKLRSLLYWRGNKMEDETTPKCPCQYLKQLCLQMKTICKTKLIPRTGTAVKEMEEIQDQYRLLGEKEGFKDCDTFVQNLLFNLGCAYEHAGDLEKSIGIHCWLTRINPGDHQALYTAGTNLCKLRRFTEAIPLLEKAVELNPRNADYWQNLNYARREGRPTVIQSGRNWGAIAPIC